ncbi:UDP-N-acetylmuramate dehydrogenase [Kocuria palustris]|uniref:UDP-N-acetylmuramate dehydrogenase n=1 Tax=Kocuria palustris TaxID=71999 RepID=UPI00119EBB7E|nr:UDP-N-acetylmuramate dehydrogenase [Kocuria palustris]
MTSADRPELSELTTTRIGGPAGQYRRARSQQEIIAAVQEADAAGRPVLLVGGGSNLLVGDDGFDGVVVHLTSQGVAVARDAEGTGALVTVQAGHSWDDVVEQTVEQGLVGLEALSGIPGTAGATPVQNVGAYGSEVSRTIESVRVWDRRDAEVRGFTADELEFAYRDSLLKRTTESGSPRYVVLEVAFRLVAGTASSPVQYGQLADALGVAVGESAPLRAVRETVLGLRGSKGMVLDPQDPDTFSTGSFFTNPIVAVDDAEQLLPADAPRFPVVDGAGAPVEGQTKLSAAWLIDRSGFGKGFGLPGTRNERLGLEGEDVARGRSAVSTKHTLAMTNRGEASAADVEALARTVRDGVAEAYGIRLVPEPVMVGFSL